MEQRVGICLTSVNPDDAEEAIPEGQFPMYEVRHESARRLVDLRLHLADLHTVLAWIELLQKQYTQHTHEATALWTAALTVFFKCFKRSASRNKLDPDKVLANEPEEGRSQFKVLEALRDKTVVHDENSYTQGAVLVPIDNPNGPVARRGPHDVFLFHASTLDDDHINNLRLLTLASISYIETLIEETKSEVDAYLKEVSRDELVGNGQYIITTPSVETATQRRRR